MQPALTRLAAVDPVMATLIETYPAPSFQKHSNYYQELVSSIISQQLSVKAAAAIERRFVDLFAGSFPTPVQILEQDIEVLRGVGLSRPKAGYIQDLAAKVTAGDIVFDTLDELSNEAIIHELTHIKGVGVWTVHMFLMFCMGRLDILPVGDLGIRNGVGSLYDLGHAATPEEVELVAEKNNWTPYQSVASWYVWQSLNNTPNL